VVNDTVAKQGMQHKIRSGIAELIGEEKTQTFYNTWLTNHTRKIDIDSLKAWGFFDGLMARWFDCWSTE
jgi:hypothetical protein